MVAEPRRIGDPALPRRIGRYDAFLQIGAGGTARVFLAVQRGAGGQKAELVVLKVLRPEVVEDEHVQALFTDEARIAMRLSHPNVIRTREVIAEPPDYVLAMDFQNGKSLLDVVSRLGRQAVPLDEHIYILTKVLAGLSYAHELKDEQGQPFGIVHRDVSPANVLVSYGGDVKLLDFGIAKATGALAATRDGVVKGKLGYAAPEQCLGQPADPRSDVYAVGVMLWEAIAGRRRASGETWQSILQARVENAEPELEEVCPDAPEALRAIVRKALARSPNDRYASARDFESDLRTYLNRKNGTPIGASRIAAMMKPHFDRDRADLHRSVETFLNTLKTNKAAKPARIPLPNRAAPASPAPQGALPEPVPAEREEHTAPIPVDAALLMLSRGETGPVPEESSKATVLPRGAPSPQFSPTTAPPPSEATTTPPPNSATATPLTATTAPPPPDAAPPSSAFPSIEPGSAEPERLQASDTAHVDPPKALEPVAAVARPIVATLPKPPPVATDAFGLVSVATPIPGGYSPDALETAGLPKKRSPLLAILMLAAGAVGLGAVVLSMRSAKPSAESAAPTASAEHASAAAANVEKVETVNVRISVDPADAVIKLDGIVLAGNPFAGAVAKDNTVHQLLVYADGCRDQEQAVHLNRDVHLLIALKCMTKGARSNLRSTAPRSANSAAAAAFAAAHATAAALAPAQPAPAAEPQAAAPAAAEPPKDNPPAEPASQPPSDDEHPYGNAPDMLGSRK